MKKLIFMLLILALFFNISKLLSNDIAIKGGTNSTTYKYNKHIVDIYSPLIGFNVLTTIDVPFYNFISFETGIGVTRMGTNLDHHITLQRDDGGILGKQKELITNIYYMDFPFVFKGFNKINKIKLYGIAGQRVLIGLTGKEKQSIYNGEITNHYTTDVEWGSGFREHKRIQYGIIFGLGFEYKNFKIEGSYYFSFTENRLNIKDGFYTTINSCQINLGYLLNLNKE